MIVAVILKLSVILSEAKNPKRGKTFVILSEAKNPKRCIKNLIRGILK